MLHRDHIDTRNTKQLLFDKTITLLEYWIVSLSNILRIKHSRHGSFVVNYMSRYYMLTTFYEDENLKSSLAPFIV